MNHKLVPTLIAGAILLAGCVAYDGPDRNGRVYQGGERDRDRDGIADRRDRDRDGDGVPNRQDARPDNPRRY